MTTPSEVPPKPVNTQLCKYQNMICDDDDDYSDLVIALARFTTNTRPSLTSSWTVSNSPFSNLIKPFLYNVAWITEAGFESQEALRDCLQAGLNDEDADVVSNANEASNALITALDFATFSEFMGTYKESNQDYDPATAEEFQTQAAS